MNKYEHYQYSHFCFTLALFMDGISIDYSYFKIISTAMMLGISIAYFILGQLSDEI